jgi:hypothetical protein
MQFLYTDFTVFTVLFEKFIQYTVQKGRNLNLS